MKLIQTIKTKTLGTWIAVFAFFFFSSCATYRDGFICLQNSSPKHILFPDSVLSEKKKLNEQTTALVTSFSDLKTHKKRISPYLLNSFFENMQAHWQIDSLLHWELEHAENDSIRNDLRRQLIGASAVYQRYFFNDKQIRRILNQGDQAFHVPKKALLHSQQFLWSPHNRDLLKEEVTEANLRGSKCHFLMQRLGDQTYHCWYVTSGTVSELFSRTIGALHSSPHPEENIGRLMPRLKKWDIVIQKSSFRLTDHFIPGHFGHAAIYLGDSIFIEGIQRGVVASDPFHFAEGDSYIVIRQKQITEEQERRMQRLLNGQIGKKYDFNYNANAPDKMTCTELVFIVFDRFNWQREQRLGMCTLFPDLLIKTALSQPEFCFPFYFNDEYLIENPPSDFIRELLNQK